MMLVDGVAGDSIPADDRGLAYGDGAFETLRVDDGVAPWLLRHHARLAATCTALGIATPAADLLATEIARVADGVSRCVVKVIVTRGSGGRGYAPQGAGAARRVVAAHPWPAHPAERWTDGIKVRWCSTRLADRTPLPGAKHLGRLAQVLARAEWDDPECAEGLMLDHQGMVVEGTASNLFAVIDGRLVTPPITGAGVAGVARGWILEHAAVLVGGGAERPLSPQEVAQAGELLVCNAVHGIWPVRELAGVAREVGPLTRTLAAALAREGFGQ